MIPTLRHCWRALQVRVGPGRRSKRWGPAASPGLGPWVCAKSKHLAQAWARIVLSVCPLCNYDDTQMWFTYSDNVWHLWIQGMECKVTMPNNILIKKKRAHAFQTEAGVSKPGEVYRDVFYETMLINKYSGISWCCLTSVNWRHGVQGHNANNALTIRRRTYAHPKQVRTIWSQGEQWWIRIWWTSFNWHSCILFQETLANPFVADEMHLRGVWNTRTTQRSIKMHTALDELQCIWEALRGSTRHKSFGALKVCSRSWRLESCSKLLWEATGVSD